MKYKDHLCALLFPDHNMTKDKTTAVSHIQGCCQINADTGMYYKNSYMTCGGLCGTARYLLFLNEYLETKAQQFVYHTYEMMHSALHMRVQQQSTCCSSAFFIL
jgi:hypothetical protein